MGQRPKRRALRIALGVLVGVVAACAVAGLVLDEPPPAGAPGPRAEALADRMLASVNAAAWAETGAVRFTFLGRHAYLWDRTREVVEVREGDLRVLLRLSDRSGIVEEGGRRVEGARARELRERAYAHFINDSYWLNPVVKIRDPGVRRGYVALEGGAEGLLVTYTRGGLTPGDSYLWEVGADGLPRRWRMYVSVIPIRGLGNTWDGWTTLATGARISTVHALGPWSVEMITDLEGGRALADLVGAEDPFAPLFAVTPAR